MIYPPARTEKAQPSSVSSTPNCLAMAGMAGPRRPTSPPMATQTEQAMRESTACYWE